MITVIPIFRTYSLGITLALLGNNYHWSTEFSVKYIDKFDENTRDFSEVFILFHFNFFFIFKCDGLEIIYIPSGSIGLTGCSEISLCRLKFVTTRFLRQCHIFRIVGNYRVR